VTDCTAGVTCGTDRGHEPQPADYEQHRGVWGDRVPPFQGRWQQAVSPTMKRPRCQAVFPRESLSVAICRLRIELPLNRLFALSNPQALGRAGRGSSLGSEWRSEAQSFRRLAAAEAKLQLHGLSALSRSMDQVLTQSDSQRNLATGNACSSLRVFDGPDGCAWPASWPPTAAPGPGTRVLERGARCLQRS
jgi:hypothetical protein